FSSRRRHTRFSRDWSSDVCSSDLVLEPYPCSAAAWCPHRCGHGTGSAARTGTGPSTCTGTVLGPVCRRAATRRSRCHLQVCEQVGTDACRRQPQPLAPTVQRVGGVAGASAGLACLACPPVRQEGVVLVVVSTQDDAVLVSVLGCPIAHLCGDAGVSGGGVQVAAGGV